jgi:hypothetical protein
VRDTFEEFLQFLQQTSFYGLPNYFWLGITVAAMLIIFGALPDGKEKEK